MIQDIAPRKFHNEYHPEITPGPADPVFHFRGRDILADPKAAEIMKPFIASATAAFNPPEEEKSDAATEAISDEMGMAMLNYMPLRTALSFSAGQVSEEQIMALLDAINK